MIPAGWREAVRRLMEPTASLLARSGISPSTLTLIGLAPAAIAGWLFATGNVRAGGVMVATSGLFDMLDGHVARLAGRQTRFGALLDSTIDRFSEIAIFLGLAILFEDRLSQYGVLLALSGSLMVSYVRARAEGLDFTCKRGLLQRPERMLILVAGAIAGVNFLRWAVWLIAVLAHVTAVERMLRVRLQSGG